MFVITHLQLLLLTLATIQMSCGTFFPFTSYRPSIYPSPRYGFRQSRSPPPTPSNYVPVQSPIFGVRILVPRGLYDLFNDRPPLGPEPNYPRPYQPPYNPFNFRPENHPNGFPPNNYPPSSYPPISPNTFINLMRAFYPDLIYRPDPRYPNVFAIRPPGEPQPPTHLPADRPLPLDYFPAPLTQQSSSPNRSFNELPPNENQLLESPLPQRNFSPPQNQPKSYNQPSYNRPQPNHLILIRTR